MSSTKSIEVVIEIPGGSRNKYEVDHETGRVHLDRRLRTSMVYPCDYGFIENTLAEDGDPVDVLVLNEDPVFPGVICNVRPVGVLYMTDQGDPDHKVICVPDGEPEFVGVNELSDLKEHIAEEITHFFQRYKDLESGKVTELTGQGDSAAAWDVINAAIEAYKG